MANISIRDFVVILLCGIILLFMISYSCHNVFNKKNINTFDVLTYIEVRTDKQSSYRQEEGKNRFIQIRKGKLH